MKCTFLLTVTSVLLALFYASAYFFEWLGPMEDEVLLWAAASLFLGFVGWMLLFYSHLSQRKTMRWLIPVTLLWLLSLMILNIFPTIFWLAQSSYSDNFGSKSAVWWGALPHIFVIVLSLNLFIRKIYETTQASI